MAHFLMQTRSWPVEGEINRAYGALPHRLSSKEVGESCLEFLHAYMESLNDKAGFYLLWLIKQVTGSDLEIPSKEEFSEESFLAFILEVLQVVPMNTWTGGVVWGLLEGINPESRKYIAKALIKNPDTTMKTIGSSVLGILNSRNCIDEIEHFHVLKACLPGFNSISF
jgi:hypothetical protein